MTEEERKTWEELGTPNQGIQLILNFALWFTSGFVILFLWRNFMVPLGVPNINYFHAMGLGLLFSNASSINTSFLHEPFWYRFTFNIVMQILFVLLGILCASLM